MIYRISLTREDKPLHFSDREAGLQWFRDNLDQKVVLHVATGTFLDGKIAHGALVDDKTGEERVAFYVVTESGIHMAGYRDVDGYLVADIGHPRNSYMPEYTEPTPTPDVPGLQRLKDLPRRHKKRKKRKKRKK